MTMTKIYTFFNSFFINIRESIGRVLIILFSVLNLYFIYLVYKIFITFYLNVNHNLTKIDLFVAMLSVLCKLIFGYFFIILMINTLKYIHLKIILNYYNLKKISWLNKFNILEMYRNRCVNYNYNYLNFIKKTCWIIIFIFSIVIFSLVTYFNYEIFDSCLRYIVNNNLITNYKVNEKGRVPISLYNLDELCELEYMVNNLASLDFYLFIVLIISIYFYIKKNKDNNKKYKV